MNRKNTEYAFTRALKKVTLNVTNNTQNKLGFSTAFTAEHKTCQCTSLSNINQLLFQIHINRPSDLH